MSIVPVMAVTEVPVMAVPVVNSPVAVPGMPPECVTTGPRVAPESPVTSSMSSGGV